MQPITCPGIIGRYGGKSTGKAGVASPSHSLHVVEGDVAGGGPRSGLVDIIASCVQIGGPVGAATAIAYSVVILIKGAVPCRTGVGDVDGFGVEQASVDGRLKSIGERTVAGIDVQAYLAEGVLFWDDSERVGKLDIAIIVSNEKLSEGVNGQSSDSHQSADCGHPMSVTQGPEQPYGAPGATAGEIDLDRSLKGRDLEYQAHLSWPKPTDLSVAPVEA